MKRLESLKIAAAAPIAASLAPLMKSIAPVETATIFLTVPGLGHLWNDMRGVHLYIYGEAVQAYKVVSLKPLANGDLQVGVVEING